MDIRVTREFANALLRACQGAETGKISIDRLVEPELLSAFHAYLSDTLAVWTYLPPQLQSAVQNAVDANGWRLSNDIFEGNIERWIKYEISSPLRPEEDAATRLYAKLTRLPNPTTPLDRAMRQIYLVEFYRLRRIFQEYFTSPNREPLTTYISIRLGLEAEQVRSICKEPAYAGERLDAIANELGGFGSLLLPHNIARTTLEKRISIQGPDFNNLVKSLADQGVRYDENTKLYYDLAGEYFSRRYDEGFRLAESLWQNKKSNRWTSAGAPRKRVQINPLVRPINTTTRGDRQLTGGGLSLQQIAAGSAPTTQTVHEPGFRPGFQNTTENQTLGHGYGHTAVHGDSTTARMVGGDDEISDLDDVLDS